MLWGRLGEADFLPFLGRGRNSGGDNGIINQSVVLSVYSAQ